MVDEAAAVPLTASPPVSDQSDSLTPVQLEKIQRVSDACDTADLDGLIHLAATKGGFIIDDLRQRAWPILLGSAIPKVDAESETPWQDLPPHRDEEQVALDVNRSFVYYPNGDTERQLNARKADLQAIIVEVLRRHPLLRYFQGYHDIVQVFLLVLGVEASPPAVRRLSLLRIRDFMLPKLSASMSHLYLLPAILYQADRTIYNFLPPNPFYALSHMLTLYAHDIQSYNDIARLFDFLLAREAVTSVYLFAVIMMSRREQLLEAVEEMDGDMDVISVVLSKLPPNLDLDAMIMQSIQLFEQYPPASLPFKAWSRISENSILKTTDDPSALSRQTLEDGQMWFDRQAEEIQKEEARKKFIIDAKKAAYRYRRPAVLTFSVAVAVLAMWAGRNRGLTLSDFWQRLWTGIGIGRLIGI